MELNELDRRAKWEKLPTFSEDQVSKQIEIPEDDLKLLCLQPCSVLMHKFNVLTRISAAYEHDCKKANKLPVEQERVKLFREKGFSIYKKFYQPRLAWYAKQRDYLRHLRQQEIYYKTNLKFIFERKDKTVDTDNPPPVIFVQDSFPDFQNFMDKLMSMPTSCHSTQDPGSSGSIFDLINQL